MGITLGWQSYCDWFFYCPLVRNLSRSALVRGPSGFRRVLGVFSLFNVSCYSRPFRGVFSWIMEPLFTYGCTLALVYLDLIPSFIGSEGFKVLEVIDGLSFLNSFVFSLVSNDIASFQPLHRLGICIGVLHRPLVLVSPGAFFLQTFATFFRVVMVIMSGDSRCVRHSLLHS